MAKKKSTAGYIYPDRVKLWLLQNDCGIERVFCPEFAECCNLSGEAFVREILHEKLNAGYVCCGHDFRFGKHAACDVTDLQRFGQQYGFVTEVIDDVCRENIPVSSTEIRNCLLEGKIEKANVLLGEPYLILQKVTHGAQLGRTIGFPTINQIFAEGQLVPKFGVYASRTRTPDGWHDSLTNIGMKPTVQYQGLPLAETYIKDFSGDVYEKELQVILLKFIRPERKFASVDELQKQMQIDLHS